MVLPLCTDPTSSLHVVIPHTIPGRSCMAVSLSLLRTFGRTFQRHTLSLCCHDTHAALGPPPKPLGMGRVARSRSTASAHLRSTLESVCSGLRPLHGACRSRRCQHHLTGLASLVRQCRASRHTRTHRPSRPVRPCFRRCGPAAALLCTDTHSCPSAS